MTYDKTLLSQAELQSFLLRHSAWRAEGDVLVRTYELASFRQALAFVNKVAEIAERENHHPDIDIRYRRVTLRLTTHDAGGLTFRDPRVAELADAALADQVAP